VTATSLWPDNRSEFDDLPTWLASALPGRPVVRGPIRVLQVKRWGGTAVFEVNGAPVVVKHAQPALFGEAAAVHAVVQRVCPNQTASLLAHGDGPGWQRSVFGFVHGPTAEESGPHVLVAVAAALGQVQAAIATADLFGLPSYPIGDMPDTLAEDLARGGDQNPALLDEFLAALPVLRHHAELLAEVVPVSIDHPDLNHSNAIVTDESVVLLDWEEATVGCPLFSLPRLLADADETSTRAAMIDSYLDALFGGRSRGTRRLLDLAMIVAPLKLAVEARAFARVLGFPHPHTNLTARLLTESLTELATGRPTAAR
jgi:hypothetical protein